MRTLIIFFCVLMIFLVPACILSTPGEDTPGSTQIPPETQVLPTNAFPTEMSATLPSPAETALPVPSATSITPPTQIPATSVPTEASSPVVRFYVQPGSPIHIANFVEPESGCNWMGMAGQVFDLDGNPLAGIVVEIGGALDGQPIQQIALTGSSPIVGPGGYVIELSNRPVQSDGTIWFQLLDQDGTPKSARILLTTSGQCEENLIVMNLVEVNPMGSMIRLPVIIKSAP
jgi:hypothetical protein